ncbi:hypothetical protein J4439_01120 [Candidatus Woesearchaeota archaeon]|nr:hypothetical protein [Candidatus Woesearchaeota archaeon]
MRLAPLLLLLFVPSVAASSVYDSWVLVGEVVTVSDQLVHTAIDDSWNKLLVRTDQDSFIIANGSCSAGKYYKYCYLGARWDLDVYGEYDYTTLKKIPEVHLTIEDITPLVSATVAVEQTVLAVNGQTKVTVTVTNSGAFLASTLSYLEELPDGVLPLSGTQGVTLAGRTVRWEGGSLSGGGGVKKFSYTVKAERPLDFTVGGNLSYVYDENTYDLAAPKQSITAKETLSVTTFSLAPGSPSINEVATLQVALHNGDPSYDARVTSYRITLPEHVVLAETPKVLSIDRNVLSWQGTLEPKENQSFEVKVKPLRSGSYSLTGLLEAEVYSALTSSYLRENSSNTQTLSVSLAALAPRVQFMLDRATVNGAEKTNVRVYLKNPDAKATYYDIAYAIDSDLFEHEGETIRFLPPDYEKLLLYRELTAPISNQTRGYPVKFSGSYRTVNNEFFTFTTESTLTVNQEIFTEMMGIELSLPDSLVENETVDVTLTLTNKQDDRYAGVEARDTITGAEVVSGSTSTRIPVLSEDESRLAYTYRLLVPPGDASSVLVKTKVDFLFKDQPFTLYSEKAAAITRPEEQAPPPEEQSAPPVEQAPPQQELPPDEQPKKVGIIKRIVKVFTDFFSWLF